mmetsp:Transcript_43011/g.135907  ORF Transcript_43011/g.135907 Transcript_43011/m.135907 type:complete len:401 (-) Transcript_43011:491-1693(-)
MVSRHHLGPAARLRRPRKREAGQRARRPRGPLLGVEGRPAPHDLGHEAYWPELVAAPPRLVSGVHPATHVHFEGVVVCVEELLHEEAARRGAVGVTRPRDAVEAGACSRRAPDEPAELRVVEVEDGQPLPHGESAVEIAHRVDHLIADRQQQHAPLVRQSAQHLAPKGVEERDVSAIRHSPAAGEWVGGVRGDEEEGESGGGCGAPGREPGGEGGHPESEPGGDQQERLRPEAALDLQVEGGRGGQVGQPEEEERVQRKGGADGHRDRSAARVLQRGGVPPSASCSSACCCCACCCCWRCCCCCCCCGGGGGGWCRCCCCAPLAASALAASALASASQPAAPMPYGYGSADRGAGRGPGKGGPCAGCSGNTGGTGGGGGAWGGAEGGQLPLPAGVCCLAS